jgi:hypothetical protein
VHDLFARECREKRVRHSGEMRGRDQAVCVIGAIRDILRCPERLLSCTKSVGFRALNSCPRRGFGVMIFAVSLR